MYILTTKEGYVYRGPDGMPAEAWSRFGIRRIAIQQGLIDWKSTRVSRVELADIRRDCLRDLAPLKYTKITGLAAQ